MTHESRKSLKERIMQVKYILELLDNGCVW